MLGACRHENILPVLGFSADRGGNQQEDGVCIVTPLMRGGSLQDRLFVEEDEAARERLMMMSDAPLDGPLENGIIPMRWDQLLVAALGAITGLEFLHTIDPAVFKPEILHRDVKPSNILLDSDGNARLGDMGLARELRQGADHLTATVNVSGTSGYLDQQVVGHGHDKLADGYAMGITLLVILTRWRAIEPEAGHIHSRCLSPDEHDFVVTIAHQLAGWPREVAMQVLSVALDLTKPERRARITVSAARERLQRLADDHLPRAAAPAVEAVERECIVCLSALRQVRFQCGHAQLCQGCADTYMQRTAPTCLICRAPLTREGLITGDEIAHETTFVPPQQRRRRVRSPQPY